MEIPWKSLITQMLEIPCKSQISCSLQGFAVFCEDFRILGRPLTNRTISKSAQKIAKERLDFDEKGHF
jgi:hypothetical protein